MSQPPDRPATIFPCEAKPMCQCYDPEERPWCICTDTEKQLRWISNGPIGFEMNAAQRAWCLAEIEQQGDSTDQSDFSGLNDHALAYQVLRAWADYCRDKGLL